MKQPAVEHISIQKVSNGEFTAASDVVAVEEPLEIQLTYSTGTGKITKNMAVTMRTPGHDPELAAGFLFTEGVIGGANEIESITNPANDPNRILVALKENVLPVLGNVARNFYTTSSCGICGKASIDAIRTENRLGKSDEVIHVDSAFFFPLQDKLRSKQLLFTDTGGIHASALFDLQGGLLKLREDVGRHNALDKLIGAALLDNQVPLYKSVLMLSGRASFELVQKAAMAGIPIIAAVGAPSSLAVEMARESGITLIGFLRNDRFNIYHDEQRVKSG